MNKIKRFEIDVEGTTQENALFQGDEFVCYADDVETIIEKLNELNDENEYLIKKRGELETKNIILKGENEELKKENQYWLKTASHFNNISHKDRDYVKRIHKENKELKEEIVKFKEWKKHIGNVKREDLDRVFGMSIYEITEAFRYYEERIKKLEKELEND